MNLKSYVNFVTLLERNPSSREENRAFGLTQVLLKNRPLAQILRWIEVHHEKLKRPLLSETFSSYVYNTTLTLVLLAFVLGFFSGLGLLSYNGAEPVNVIYFMVMVIVLPLGTMLLTGISMLRAKSKESILVHLSPAFWMEKILNLLPSKVQENIRAFKLNSLLSNWLIIKRSQMIALFFSWGLLFALLAMVTTKDIAFAWSTTLQITPETFHEFLQTVAFPWKDLVPSAVPSMALIEQSQYFRLGDTLNKEMITHASQLGEWWKFLAFATLFYAIFLRTLMFTLSSFGLKRALKQSFFTLEGSIQLLREINEPIISTHAMPTHATFVSDDSGYGQNVNTLDASYDSVQGWAITKDDILVLVDLIEVITPKHFKVGGANSLDEDDEVISKSEGEVLLLGKSWEHPANEFLDYVIDLSEKVDKVIVMPIGKSDNPYDIKVEDIDEWVKKIASIHNEKVWLKL
ncbi:MAG: DUF2868 domain-containing protein [Sulfurovum sp.]|nr:DUF2868 domain-containing protein [Sulfurovum sp.]